MSSIQHILAATDLSSPAMPAVDRALQLAHATGASCTVVQALGLDALGPLRALLGERAEEASRQIGAHQQATLDELLRERSQALGLPMNVRVQAGIEPGLATTALAARARRENAQLVVIGARGGSTLRRHLVGSTASRLLRTSHSSVLVVKHACLGPYRRVLVAVDFSPASKACIDLVRVLAPQATLVLLHAFDVPFEGLLHYAGVSKDEIHRHRAEARGKAMLALHDLARQHQLRPGDHTVLVEHGHAAHHILEVARHHHCDLIAMGKHGTHVTEELLLGSVTLQVLSEGDQDLLVMVDPRDAAEAGTGNT